MTAQPRLLFMAKPQPEVLSAMVNAVTASGLDTLLGRALFAPENWHLSLSLRYFEPEFREQLLRAGSRISATAFAMTLNRINSQGDAAHRIRWGFRARGEPKGFRELLLAVQAALRAEGLEEERGHSPQVTICYWAPSRLPSRTIMPIEWIVDEILLVEGGGQPYYYRTLGRWPLLPAPHQQLRLF